MSASTLAPDSVRQKLQCGPGLPDEDASRIPTAHARPAFPASGFAKLESGEGTHDAARKTPSGTGILLRESESRNPWSSRPHHGRLRDPSGWPNWSGRAKSRSPLALTGI
uniref:Uncharacterized protein n=1 Tax=Mycena chlorophos TaxID=658473 RepID=A0ABQ0LCL7_MYCCL|nr:predicted protein [Mycena chlorophos]